nr:hypothetical protein [Tanacetum cinerariifolium]
MEGIRNVSPNRAFGNEVYGSDLEGFGVNPSSNEFRLCSSDEWRSGNHNGTVRIHSNGGGGDMVRTSYIVDHQNDCKEEWVLYTDGASSVKGSGAGLVLISPTKTEYTYALRLNFESTNNQAEYEALLAGLRIAKKIRVRSLSINAKLVVAKAIRQGYYWPVMHRDAREEIRNCDSLGNGCPWAAPRSLREGEVRNRGRGIFYKEDRSQAASQDDKEVKKFVWDNIICKSLIKEIKTQLRWERKGWVDELPNILWAHRTSLKTSNKETSYSSAFRSGAVIPVEIGMPTHRTMMIKEGEVNEEEMRLNLYFLQERREAAAIQKARYKTKIKHYYNKRVHPMSFKVGEYVYWKNEASWVENLES